MQTPEQHIYQSFLIRCWLVPAEITEEQPGWRFELLKVSAEPQKYRFSDFEQLQAFISADLAASEETSGSLQSAKIQA